MKKTAKKTTTAAVEVMPAEHPMAAALTSQYRRAEYSRGQFVREAVAFGVMLMNAEETVSATEESVKNAGRGAKGAFIKVGASIEPWLTANCPDINYKTAMGYKALASKMVALMGGATPEILAALASPSQMQISYCDGDASDVVDAEVIELRDKLYADATSRRKLEQMWFNFCSDGEGSGKEPKPLPKLSQRDEAKAIWNGVMVALSKSSVRDAIPLLGEKETQVCHDGLRDLLSLLKKHLEEF